MVKNKLKQGKVFCHRRSHKMEGKQVPIVAVGKIGSNNTSFKELDFASVQKHTWYYFILFNDKPKYFMKQ